MSINPMQSAHRAPRCKARSKRASRVVRLWFEAVAVVGCTGLAVERRPESRTGIIGRIRLAASERLRRRPLGFDKPLSLS